jgi:amino acid transporter
MIFAFARDRGLPVSEALARVSRRYRTPAAAVWLAAALSFALPCVILCVVGALPKRIDFSKLYPAVTGISTIGLYLSYGIPLLLKLRAIRRGMWTSAANGPWSLGNWSVTVNLVAVIWIGFITILFVLPPNELTGWVFGGWLAMAIAFYWVRVRGRFKGPVPQATSRDALLKIESELGDR